MKTFIFSIAIAAICLASCSKDSPEPTYTSLVGKWKFTTKTVPITGSFEITEVAGVLTIGNTFGEFKLDGTTYNIDNKYAMESGTPGSFNEFWLLHNATQDVAFVSFLDSEYSDDFKTITAKKFHYGEGNSNSAVYEETIVITRN